MAQKAGRTTSIPTDLELKIHFSDGQFTIIPKLNRENFVRLNASRISFIEEGGEDAPTPPKVNIEPPKVENPTITADPSMQWKRPKLLKHAKNQGIKYTAAEKSKTGVTKTEILADILTKNAKP